MTDSYDDLDEPPKLPLKVRDEVGAEVDSIAEAVHANLRKAAAQLSTTSTPQEQVTLLTAMTMMKQLIGILENPPEVESWSDVQRIHKMARETLDMDGRAAGKNSADFSVINNFKPTKGRTIDAETVGASVELNDTDSPKAKVRPAPKRQKRSGRNLQSRIE